MAITPKLSLPVKCWSSRMLLLVQALGGALGYTHTVDSRVIEMDSNPA
jgi:hypothetical protein